MTVCVSVSFCSMSSVSVTRDSKLTMLLRESLGNMNCRTTMIAHISASPRDFSETLFTIQIASRVLRMKKKKAKVAVVSLAQTLLRSSKTVALCVFDIKLYVDLIHQVYPMLTFTCLEDKCQIKFHFKSVTSLLHHRCFCFYLLYLLHLSGVNHQFKSGRKKMFSDSLKTERFLSSHPTHLHPLSNTPPAPLVERAPAKRVACAVLPTCGRSITVVTQILTFPCFDCPTTPTNTPAVSSHVIR